jgi:hypothetical protein
VATAGEDAAALSAAMRDALTSLASLLDAMQPYAGQPAAAAAIAATAAVLGLSLTVQDICRHLVDQERPRPAAPGPPAAGSARGG